MSPQLGPYALLPNLLEFTIDGDNAILAAGSIKHIPFDEPLHEAA